MTVLRSLPALLSLVLVIPAVAADAPAEKLPAGAKVVSLSVRPASIDLATPFAYAQLVVTAKLDSGESADVTRIAQWTAPKAAKVSPTGVVRPLSDGSGELTATVDGLTAKVGIKVSGQKATPTVDFVRDVQPVLSKTGCNAGTCHGAAQGKVGFKLSLRGYDPIFDHRALTDDLEGRRFNRAAPDKSLMLMKPAGAVPHIGGVLCQPGEPYYELLKAWIADGVKLDLSTPRVTGIEVFPLNPTVARIGAKQQFAVIATYADGSKRDVSQEAFIDSSNTEVATVDKTGLMTAVRRGEATMLARYEGAYAASTVIVTGDRSGFVWNQPPVLNWIDELVDAKLKKVKVTASPLCDDAEFVRRVNIDLTGLPPTADAVRAFLADARHSTVKRDELIDKLIGSPEFIDHWTNKWADLLQVNRKFLGDKGAAALKDWVRKAVADNMPYDKFAYDVLTANGSNVENPPASYYKVLRTPDAVMENTTQLFLAIRFNCNKCHDHPFEKWTQDQYYQLSAYFAQVSLKEDPKYKGQKLGGTAVEKPLPLVEVIADAKEGEVKHDRTGAVTPPKFPYPHGDLPASDLPRRTQAAKWITSKDNPYFAKSYVNRIWSYLTGVGIIEPVDDIRAGNPPTNPELLDRLTKEFVASGFDTRAVMRTICKSRTYQLSIATTPQNKDDEINYSHALPRRLPAEVLFDSIHRATGSRASLPGLPKGGRAAQLLDSNVELPGGFLELFGKPVRESACECERSNTMMLGPVLAMVNGPIVADAVKDPAGDLARFVASTKDDAKAVEQIYLSVLNRYPTKAEADAGVTALGSAGADFDRLTNLYKERKAAFAAYTADLDSKQHAWEQARLAEKPTDWKVLKVKKAESVNGPTGATATDGATLTVQDDGSILASGKTDAYEKYTIELDADLKLPITALRLEVLADPSLPAKGPGRAPNGNFVLTELAANVGKGAANAIKFAPNGAEATFAQDGFPAKNALDGNRATGWAISPQFGKPQSAMFKVQRGGNVGPDKTVTVTLTQEYGGSHAVGKFRLAVTTDKTPKLTSPLTPELAKLFETPEEDRTAKQKARLREMFLAQDQEYQRLAKSVETPPPTDPRLLGAQDLVWALINSPAFLFNH